MGLRQKCLNGKNEITKSDIDQYLDELGDNNITDGQARPIVKAYQEYCDGVRALRKESSTLESDYQDMISGIAIATTNLKDSSEKIRLLRDQFMEQNSASMEVSSLSILNGTKTNVWNPAFSIFENWVDGNPASVNPSKKGYFFKPYTAEAAAVVNGIQGEVADIITAINILLFNLDSHISATGMLEDKDVRAVQGGDDGGVVDSSAVERIVNTASSMKIRYLAGFDGDISNKEIEKYLTWGVPATFVSILAAESEYSAFASYPVVWNYKKPIFYNSDGTTRSSAASSLGSFSSNAADVAGYGESTSADVQLINYKGEKTTVSDAAVAETVGYDLNRSDVDVPEIAEKDQQKSISFVSGYAKDYAFYDVKNSDDSSKAGFSDSATYDNIRHKLTSLSVVWRELGKELTYLERINNYIQKAETLANSIGTHIQSIINLYVDFQEKSNEFSEKADDLSDELRKDLGLKRNGKYYYPRELRSPKWFRSIDDFLEDEFSGNLENFEAEAYRKNPEKLFYKEQCFLLTYITRIANNKKNNIDGYSSRVKKGSASEKAGLSSRELVMSTPEGGKLSEDFVSGYGKRIPYTPQMQHKDSENIWPGNASLLLDGDPYGFLNKIAISKNLSPLYNIPSDILSNLQPYIRLFKVEFDDETGEEKDIEISFEPAFTSFEKDLYENRRVRAAGTGLKSFKFTYDGSNPFGAKKSIKATLSIFSNSFDELMIERRSPTGTRDKYRYVDLAIKTFNTGESKFKDIIRENEELMKLNFRLKAQVGYSIPNNFSSLTRIDKKKLQSALRDSVVTLNLIPTIHDFSFDELARVNFTINYLAYVEDTFSQAKFNVFSSPDFASARIERNLKMDYYSKKCKPEAVADIKKSYSAIAHEEISDSISHLMSTMIDRDKIYYMPISTEQVKEFVSFGPYAEDTIFNNPGMKPQILQNDDYMTQLETSIDQGLKTYEKKSQEKGSYSGAFNEKEEKIISASLASMDPNKNILAFFYASELIDIILENVETELNEVPERLAEKKKQNNNVEMYGDDEIDEKIKEYEKYLKAFKKTRFLLGPVEFASANNLAESIFVNLGDIPISVKYFFEWITSTMLNKDQSFYSLTKFMNDFFNDLVTKFLNNDRCFDYSVKQRSRLYQSTLLGAGTTVNDLISSHILKIENLE